MNPKIDKEMAEHLIKYHTEYITTMSSNRDITDIFTLLKYIINNYEKRISDLEKKESK